MVSRYATLFLTAISAEHGMSANTLESYGRDLQGYDEFLASHDTDYKNCSTEHIRSYLKDLHDVGLKHTTIARHLSTIRQLHRFLHAEGYRDDNPTQVLDTPKVPRNLPKILTIEEVDKLLRTAHEDTSYHGIRLACLLEMLYATGLRITELVSLSIASVQGVRTGQNPWLTVKGKGQKERIVHLSKPAQKILLDYLKIRDYYVPAERGGSPYLFPSGSEHGHMTRQNVGQQLKKIARLANLNANKVSPHVLRHAFASHMLMGGADLRVVQTLLGHTHITTTQIYTHVADDRLSQAVQQNHPLAQTINQTIKKTSPKK